MSCYNDCQSWRRHDATYKTDVSLYTDHRWVPQLVGVGSNKLLIISCEIYQSRLQPCKHEILKIMTTLFIDRLLHGYLPYAACLSVQWAYTMSIIKPRAAVSYCTVECGIYEKWEFLYDHRQSSFSLLQLKLIFRVVSWRHFGSLSKRSFICQAFLRHEQ